MTGDIWGAFTHLVGGATGGDSIGRSMMVLGALVFVPGLLFVGLKHLAIRQFSELRRRRRQQPRQGHFGETNLHHLRNRNRP